MSELLEILMPIMHKFYAYLFKYQNDNIMTALIKNFTEKIGVGALAKIRKAL